MTPKVSQLQEKGVAAESGAGGMTASEDQPSGLLSWMKSALQMPGQGGPMIQRSRKSSASSNSSNPVPISPSGLPSTQLEEDADTTRSNRSSISNDSHHTSGEESAAEELYAPFKPRTQSSSSSTARAPMMVVKPRARRDVSTVLGDSDDLSEKPVLLDALSSGSKREEGEQDEQKRQSLVLDGECSYLRFHFASGRVWVEENKEENKELGICC